MHSIQQVKAQSRLPIYWLAPEHFSDLCFPLYRRPQINQLQVLFPTKRFGKSTLPFVVPVRMCCDAATRTPLLLLVNLQSVFFAFSLVFCKCMSTNNQPWTNMEWHWKQRQWLQARKVYLTDKTTNLNNEQLNRGCWCNIPGTKLQAALLNTTNKDLYKKRHQKGNGAADNKVTFVSWCVMQPYTSPV